MDWEQIWSIITTWCMEIAWKLLWGAVALAVGIIFIKIVVRCFPKGTKKHPLDPTVRGFLISAVKMMLYIVLAIILIGILGAPLASVITVLGSAGVAISLALQGSLSNIAGGIMLLIFKPLKIGDFVEVEHTSGTVEDVGLYYTTLISPDHKRIEMPNSKMTSGSIINYSTEKERRVDITVGVAYGTDVEKTKELIMKTVLSHEKVLKDPMPTVRLSDYADSSLNISVRAWCENADFWDVKFDLTEQIKSMLDENNIIIPFPQVDVHMK